MALDRPLEHHRRDDVHLQRPQRERRGRAVLTERGELGRHRSLHRYEHELRLRLLVHQRDEMGPLEHLVAQLASQRRHALTRGTADGLQHTHVGQHAIDQRIEQRPSVAHVPVDAGDRHTQIFGKAPHRERVEAVLFDDAPGGVDHVVRGECCPNLRALVGTHRRTLAHIG